MTEYDEVLNWLRSQQDTEVAELNKEIAQSDEPYKDSHLYKKMGLLLEMHRATIYSFENSRSLRESIIKLYHQQKKESEEKECLAWLRSQQDAEVEQMRGDVINGSESLEDSLVLARSLGELHFATICLFKNNPDFRAKFVKAWKERGDLKPLSDEEMKKLFLDIVYQARAKAKQ